MFIQLFLKTAAMIAGIILAAKIIELSIRAFWSRRKPGA